MKIAVRVAGRARLRTAEWVNDNALLLGLLSGCSLTLLLIDKLLI
jgi:hypothetical protein